MQILSAWIHDLVVVVALAAVVEMLLPGGGFRRFALLVMGLLVVLALAKPLLGYMQVVIPAGGGSLSVVPNPSSGGYSLASEGSGFPSADAALRDSLAAHLSRLVAASLGLEPGDVAVEVGLEGQAGWPHLLRYLRVRVTRAPEALVQAWLAAQTAGDPSAAGPPPPGGSGVQTPTRDDAMAAIGRAVSSQLAAIYRLNEESIRVIMPR